MALNRPGGPGQIFLGGRGIFGRAAHSGACFSRSVISGLPPPSATVRFSRVTAKLIVILDTPLELLQPVRAATATGSP
jgi:hypothetical protein